MIPVEKAFGDEPHVAVAQIIASDCAGQAMPRYVKKTWGHEVHYRNDNRYCMKLLHFQGPEINQRDGPFGSSTSTSMHFHVLKHETLLVTKGILTLETIVNKQTIVHKLVPGMAFVVCPGFVHRLAALDGELELIEASTQDFEDDSVRIN